jgi:ribonuclease-3
MAELNDQERVALLTERLGLAAGSLPAPLALEALRHGSYVHERRGATADSGPLQSNERLEFLGDAVLDLCISVRCCELFPELSEGALTRTRAAIVNEDALASVARSIGLGELLLLGRGEERSGGRDKQSLLADAVEAVIAAVHLGCGFEIATRTVDRLLQPLLQAAASGTLGRDYKTELQEISQAVHRASPSYRVVDAPGPQHARVFEVEVSLGGGPLGRGTGRTKKDAEQAAARAAIDALDARAAALDLDAPTDAPAGEGAAPPSDPAGE